MLGKYEGDKKSASSANQPQPKPLKNSGRQTTPIEQNTGQFKAKPAPSSNSVKDAGQTQKQTKGQQNQAKQANDTKDVKQMNKTVNNAKQTSTSKQAANTSQAKSQVQNNATKTAQKKDPFKTTPNRNSSNFTNTKKNDPLARKVR